ncbi:hypothetical protein EKL29_04930 [Pantoea sp. YU22]|uniref:hypothetical protein n=1 Tax=Pantoea TaxID=53335 RepID=UPI000F861C50|nr:MULTISPECIES: hypothetical protein [Pantoea]RTY59094.1 hypothetical protein EKL29_04930 [Pantoea sp. YU22]
MSTISKRVFSMRAKENILRFTASLVELVIPEKTGRKSAFMTGAVYFNSLKVIFFTDCLSPVAQNYFTAVGQHIVARRLYLRVNNARNEFYRKIVG